MEELIFFAVIIFFSILESIARSRKAKKGRGDEEESTTRSQEWDGPARETERDRAGQRQHGQRLPTYDQDPSYDDLATGPEAREDRTLEQYTRPYGAQEAPSSSTAEERRPSSETMLPGDLLEQLEGLARGRQAERRRKQTGAPTEEARRRAEVRRKREEADRRREEARVLQDEALRRQEELRHRGGREAPSRALPSLEQSEVGSGEVWSGGIGSTAPVGSRAPIGSGEHEVHRSHAEYGTDPSSRRPSREGRIDPFAEPLDAQGVAVRRQLLGRGRKALRDAVVIKEVLGEPVALRDDHLGGL